ncbi:MAG: hypothetical protein ACRBEQ_12055 [Hyphomonas sp.]
MEDETEITPPEDSKPVKTSPVKALIEECGRHPFVTGLFAIIGVCGFVFSIYAFGVDRADSRASSDKQDQELANIERLGDTVSNLPGATEEPADFDPLVAHFDPAKRASFNDNIVFSSRHKGRLNDDLKYNDFGDMRDWLYQNDPEAFAHEWVMSFNVTSQADLDFTQIAPYLVVDVLEVRPVPDDMILFYVSERGAGASVREFSAAIPPEKGRYYAPLIDTYTGERRTDVDYFTLMPREPEEFIFWPSIDAGFIYEMRIGLHYKYKQKHRIHWVTPIFRNGIPKDPLPVWDFSRTYEIKASPDAEFDDPAATKAKADANNAYVAAGKVFRPDQLTD